MNKPSLFWSIWIDQRRYWQNIEPALNNPQQARRLLQQGRFESLAISLLLTLIMGVLGMSADVVFQWWKLLLGWSFGALFIVLGDGDNILKKHVISTVSTGICVAMLTSFLGAYYSYLDLPPQMVMLFLMLIAFFGAFAIVIKKVLLTCQAYPVDNWIVSFLWLGLVYGGFVLFIIGLRWWGQNMLGELVPFGVYGTYLLCSWLGGVLGDIWTQRNLPPALEDGTIASE